MASGQTNREIPDLKASQSDLNSSVRDRYAKWQAETLEPCLNEQGEWKSSFVTQSLKWPVKSLYTPLDLEAIGFDYMEDVGFPGEFPYTRSTEPNGYRTQLWNMLQTTGFGTGEDSNQRWRYMLDQGLNGLIIEYDLPTTNGYDSDHPLAAGEVCRAGTAIDTLADMEAALDLPFEKVEYLTSVCNAPQPINLAMIISALENKGVDPHTLRLQMPNFILVEYTCVGRYIYPPKHGLRIAIDVMEYSIRNYPNWVPISIVSAQLYAARANVVQELAFGFAMAMEYLDAILARGFDIDEVAPYFSFITGVDMDFFEAVAKLRAYRKIWAKLMRDKYGAKKKESLQLKLMGSPGTMSMALQQPLNNIARLGIQMLACAAANGGQAMNIPLHDEAHALPSDEAVAVGAAIQNIVAHESGVTNTTDPFAGSYYVETMTKQIETAVFEEMQKIEDMGGALAAIEGGYFQKELAREQIQRNKDIESGDWKFIGVNYLQRDEPELQIDMFELESDAEQRQIENLNKVKAERDNEAVQKALDKVRSVAATDENLMPSMLEAVQVYASHGELCDALRDVYGEYHPDSLTLGV